MIKEELQKLLKKVSQLRNLAAKAGTLGEAQAGSTSTEMVFVDRRKRAEEAARKDAHDIHEESDNARGYDVMRGYAAGKGIGERPEAAALGAGTRMLGGGK